MSVGTNEQNRGVSNGDYTRKEDQTTGTQAATMTFTYSRSFQPPISVATEHQLVSSIQT